MDIEIFKGSIDIIILSTLISKTSYGYEISKVIKEKSNNTYEIGEGTLYTSLKRLESKKFITSCWQIREAHNRKYYSITNSGREHLQEKVLGVKNLNILLNGLMEEK